MTQEAVVVKIINKDMAEVAVTRGTACGGNCGSCEACVFDNEIHTEAHNKISALPGQKVLIETQSSKVYKAAFWVYILPFIFFFIGYAVAAALGAGETLCMLVSFLAFCIAVTLMVVKHRKQDQKDKIEFNIIQLMES